MPFRTNGGLLSPRVRAALHYSQKRRKYDVLPFGSMISTPTVLTGAASPGTSGSFTMPANGLLGISYSVATSAGDVVVNLATGRQFGTPALVADQVREIGFIERGMIVDVELTAALAGTATFHVADPLHVWKAIATATFT